MDLQNIDSLIASLGFPIVCVLGLSWFAFYLIRENRRESESYMDMLRENCASREDKLFEEIKENREINAKAISTIAMYSEKLDGIQKDINDIKTDIAVMVKK